MPVVLVKPGEADRILAGHPWLYQGSILRLTRPADDGSAVQVKDHRQRFLGVGFYNSKSKIGVRVLSHEREALDSSFLEKRIRAAVDLRRRQMPSATSFRVVNAESDFLSGLIVDKYEDVLVLQTPSLGMDQRKTAIIAILKKLFQPKAIFERNDSSFRKFEGMAEAHGLLDGQWDGPILVRINGLRFEVPIESGHKTGLYLDQQVNYQRVADLIPQGQVLDCFCFLGGFALHSARAKATHVHAIDQSAEAIRLAETAAKANGAASKCSFETANVFDWLKHHTLQRPNEKLVPRFDAVILDPPSFTRSRAAVGDAMRGYKEIHLRALKLLRPSGLLATFCCSHHVDSRLFLDAILAAAYDARKILRQVAAFSQSPDHPIIPSIPETEYLKGFAFELAN